jgi:hypothetical protein
MPFSMRAIVPPSLQTDPVRLRRVIENALEMHSEDIAIDFKVTTQTWKRKPKFQITKKPWKRLIFTDNKIYFFISGGTKKHRIPSIHNTNAKTLRFFRTGFKPKSRVNYIGSKAGQAASKNLTMVKSVMHPGTKARNFDEVIAKKWRKLWPKLLQRALIAEMQAKSRGQL